LKDLEMKDLELNDLELIDLELKDSPNVATTKNMTDMN